jgi:lipoprotein-releasing system ATP-binding protein
MTDIVLQTKGINKFFHDPVKFQVLNDITFSIRKGEFVTITGKSGCGKSTLLYILSTMDTDYEGELFIGNEAMKSKDGAGLARVRNEKIGFVFQFHYLLPEFSVLRNVMLPAQKLGLKSEDEIEAKAMEHLKMLGIADQALKNANMLSGGQKQRVAIARALINDPLIIMGDEPTGNLDSKNSAIVFDLFKEIAATGNRSLLVVTHDEDIARGAQRNIVMDDGRMVK